MFNILVFLEKKNNSFLDKKKTIKKGIDFNNFNYVFFIENQFIKKYEKKFEYFKELYLRCKADIENFKKKSNQEITKSYKYSLEDFSENLLPVIDSLESTLNGKFSKLDDFLEGVRLTLKLFLNVLNKKNINYILPQEGDDFDPNKHLAVSKISCENKKDNSIINVLQKGYYISERILRPALVVVNKVE